MNSLAITQAGSAPCSWDVVRLKLSRQRLLLLLLRSLPTLLLGQCPVRAVKVSGMFVHRRSN